MSQERPRNSYYEAKGAPMRRHRHPQSRQLFPVVNEGDLEDWDYYGIGYEDVTPKPAEEEQLPSWGAGLGR